MNQRKIGVILSYLNILTVVLSQLLYTPIMLVILGQVEYGIFSLSQSVIFYLGLLNFGFLGSYFKFYSASKINGNNDEIKRLNAIYIIIVICISLIMYIIGWAVIDNVNYLIGDNFSNKDKILIQDLLKIMLITMVITIFNNLFSAILAAREKFVFCKCMDFLKNIGNPLISLPVILLGFGSIGMSYVLLIISIVTLLLNIKYSLLKLKVGFLFKNINSDEVKKVYKFSVYILLWGLIDQINLHSGKLILSNVLGAEAIAVYTIGIQFCILFIIFSDAIMCVFIPKIYDLVYEIDSKKKLTNLMIKVGRLQCFVICFIWLGFVIFGKYFIKLWAGSEYLESYWVAVLIMSSLLIPLIQNMGIEILKAYNKYRIRTICHFLIFIASLLISIKLANIYGIIGCTLGSSFFIIFSNVIIANYFYTIIKLEIKRFFKEIFKILPAIFISLLVGIVIVSSNQIKNFTDLLFDILLFSIVYLWLIKNMAFNSYENELFEKTINKIYNLVKFKVKI